MRRLIADIYVIMLRISGFKILSLIVAIAYISLLNLITIYGLSILLKDIFPLLSYVSFLFKFPYIIFFGIAVVLFNFSLMFPLKNISKLKNKPMYFRLVLYTAISCLLYIYIKYGDKIF